MVLPTAHGRRLDRHGSGEASVLRTAIGLRRCGTGVAWTVRGSNGWKAAIGKMRREPWDIVISPTGLKGRFPWSLVRVALGQTGPVNRPRMFVGLPGLHYFRPFHEPLFL